MGGISTIAGLRSARYPMRAVDPLAGAYPSQEYSAIRHLFRSTMKATPHICITPWGVRAGSMNVPSDAELIPGCGLGSRPGSSDGGGLTFRRRRPFREVPSLVQEGRRAE